MKNYSLSSLTALSPIDGRYKFQTEELSNYFSEFAYIKNRTEIEVEYLIALSKIGIIRKLSEKEIKLLKNLVNQFNLEECLRVKRIEEKTKHDLKSIEYYLKEKLTATSLSDTLEFIHFGLTSEDINNISIRLVIRNANNSIVIPYLKNLVDELRTSSGKYKDLAMLARTHGQPAVPTTYGKELLVFCSRLEKEVSLLISTKLTGKLNGAVGNYNALYFVYPKINWINFSKKFISSFNLEPNLVTNQVNPPEDIIYYFQTIQRINGIILDLNQDMWRYISDGWLVQENTRNEVGSSTMPQKINPIQFENSEGNIVMANSLIHGFVDKLPISRLQRDLSGSTISRNFGSAIAYSLIAWQNSLAGLKKIKPNKKQIEKDLNEDYSILSEAVQTYLKKEGIKNGYEIIKNLTKGEKMDEESWIKLIDNLSISADQKKELRKLKTDNYLGLLVNFILG